MAERRFFTAVADLCFSASAGCGSYTTLRGATAAGRDGGAPRCAALNRKGKPCGREPIWGTPFCVSHTSRGGD